MDPKTHIGLTIGQNLVWLSGFFVLVAYNNPFPTVPTLMLAIIISLNAYAHIKYYSHSGAENTGKIFLIINTFITFAILFLDNSTFEQIFILALVGDSIFAYETKFSRLYILVTYILLIPYYVITYSGGNTWQYQVSVFRDALVASAFITTMYIAKYAIRSNLRNQELLAARNKAYDKLTEFAGQIETMAAMDERHRIALVLHNSLGHALTSTVLTLQAEKRELIKEGLLKKSAFTSVEEQLQGALSLLRSTVAGNEGFYAQYPLDTLLDMFVSEASNNTRVGIHYTSSRTDRIPVSMNNLIYNLVQEAVTNAMKHSGCSNILITATVSDLTESADETITLEVIDDGKGFGTSVLGFGMTHSRDAILETGGQYKVCDRDGCVIHMEIPLKGCEIYDQSSDC